MLLAWLLLAAPAHAQPIDSGNITANSSGGACTAVPPACVVVTFSNQLITTITLQVSGTYTGTTAFEATSSANPLATSAVWFAVTATNLADGSSATGTTSGQTGQFSIPNSGLMGVRVRATAAWSGTAVVAAVRGYAVAWRLSPFFTRVYTGDGTAALPAKSYFSDTDLGSYRIGANNEGFSAGGTLRWDYNTTRILSTIPFYAPDGAVSTPSYTFGSATTLGFYNNGGARVDFVYSGVSRGGFNVNGIFATVFDVGANSDVILARDAANVLAQRNGTNAQTARRYGYISGARATYEGGTCTTVAVTLTGATTATTNFIPAGATVESVATSTTTTITNATGYTVGDGSDADRWGSVTGTAVGTVTGSTNYTADPRWWTNAARAITLTALTADFTGGVVQVMACWRSATGT